MSGTIGTTPRWPTGPAGVVARLGRRLRPLRDAASRIRSEGGLPPSLALPLAAALTCGLLWATISVVGAWNLP